MLEITWKLFIWKIKSSSVEKCLAMSCLWGSMSVGEGFQVSLCY